MKKFLKIQTLIFYLIHQTQGKITKAEVDQEVKKHFPYHEWTALHWAWFRVQIKKKHFTERFSPIEIANLFPKAVLQLTQKT